MELTEDGAKKTLIIDDDPDVVLFLSTILQDHGYQTVDAQNGQEGWEMVKSENPDLVLLDLMMPQKSGIPLLSDIKRDENLKPLNPEGYIEKAVDPDKLITLIKELLG